MWLIGQLESAMHPSRQHKVIGQEIAVPKLCREQDGYFLFFIFRIATINPADANITMNSSYVLLIVRFSAKLGTDESTFSGCLGKHTIFLQIHYSNVGIIIYRVKQE